MKKLTSHFRKIMAMLVSVVMMASALPVGTVGVFAATGIETGQMTISGLPDKVSIDDVFTLTANMTTTPSERPAVKWKSSSPKVIAVNENTGSCEALKKGNATITATCGSQKASVRVTVGYRQASHITVYYKQKSERVYLGEGETVNMVAGKTQQFYGLLLGTGPRFGIPDSACVDQKKIEYSSSDPTIATISSKGKVKAKKGGQVTITAHATDGSDLSFHFVLNIDSKVKKIKITGVPNKIYSLDVFKLKAEISPLDEVTAAKKVTFTAKPEDVIFVSENGECIPLDAGKATITATCDGKSKSINVTVKHKPATFIGIYDNDGNEIPVDLPRRFMSAGQKIQFTAYAFVDKDNPWTFLQAEQKFKWSSSNTKAVTVDQNGNVTAIKEGNSKITVKTKDGKVKRTFEIYVNPTN